MSQPNGVDELDSVIQRSKQSRLGVLRSVFAPKSEEWEWNFPDSEICKNCDGQGEVEIEGMFYACRCEDYK